MSAPGNGTVFWYAILACMPAFAGDLAHDFINPPHEAKPWIYYTFMNGWADKAVMARELADLKKMGVGGVLHLQNRNLSSKISGPPLTNEVTMLSPEWDQWFGEMLGMAHRAGLTISATICDGHGLGGPWIKPEDGCKTMVWSETQVAGPSIEAIQMNDDFGAQETLQISPGMFREIFKPRMKRWIEFVKARTQAKVFLHCDGAVRELLPDFIEIGIDVLNPMQTGARDMDPESIKREYGRDLSFWGAGVDTQTTLPFGSIADIQREVRERVSLLSKGGGFVFGTIHNIQPDIPPEKIVAVFDTARENGALS